MARTNLYQVDNATATAILLALVAFVLLVTLAVIWFVVDGPRYGAVIPCVQVVTERPVLSAGYQCGEHATGDVLTIQ